MAEGGLQQFLDVLPGAPQLRRIGRRAHDRHRPARANRRRLAKNQAIKQARVRRLEIQLSDRCHLKTEEGGEAGKPGRGGGGKNE